MRALTPNAPPTGYRESAPRSDQSEVKSFPGLAIRLRYPSSTAVILHLTGELDSTTAPRLHELMAPRLASAVETVILDLSELRFLGVAGLQLLLHTRRVAARRAKNFQIVDGPVCVTRALRAAKLTGVVATYPTIASAVDDLSTRPGEDPAAQHLSPAS